MRYADGPTTEAVTVVAAPPERIWPFVVDVRWLAGFSSELQRVEWLDGATEAAPGARFRGHSEHPAVGSWSTVCTVTACDPPRRFAWAVEADAPDGAAAVWTFELDPGDDGTRLRQWARMGPGRSGLTPAIEARPDLEERIVERRLDEWRDGMERNLAAIRDAAESG